MTTPCCALHGESLTLRYGSRPPVIDGQTIAVAPARISALVGPNGSGKSTMLKALGRHLAPSKGVVTLDGKDIARLPARALARQLGILFQENGQVGGVTVEDLVMHGRHPHRGFLEDLSRDDEAAVEKALTLTGTIDLRHRRLEELSGGQRQLAWLALALAQEPRVLLLDEPTTFLDLRHQMDVMRVIVTLRDQDDLTVLMVLHDVNQAARYADDLFAMRDGRIVAQGAPRELITPEFLLDVFGIAAEVLLTSSGHPVCVPVVPIASKPLSSLE